MFVSIIIVNDNSGDRLKRCLTCLAAQTYINFEAIVFDNTSTDGSDCTPLPDQRFRMIKSSENIGSAGGNNHAAKIAKGEWLAIISPHCYVEPEWLMTLMTATKRHPACAAFASAQISDADPEILDGCGYNYNFAGFSWLIAKARALEDLPDESEVFAPSATATLLHAEAFREVQGFDERFSSFGHDVDLGFRLRLRGYQIVLVCEAMVRHDAPPDTDSSIFQLTRNLIWIFTKNMPDILFWPLLPFHIIGNILALCHLKTAIVRWDAISMTLKNWRDLSEHRRSTQATRIASTWRIARAVCWSLRKTFWQI